jgi:uncharacterized protein (DUF486 family)
MTLAWYGHLRFRNLPLLWTILASWLIALPEYSFQVPANRFGYGHFTATQLKVFQEGISLTVFVIFIFFYLGETPTWRTALAFMLIVVAVLLVQPSSSAKHKAPRENSLAGAATKSFSSGDEQK